MRLDLREMRCSHIPKGFNLNRYRHHFYITNSLAEVLISIDTGIIPFSLCSIICTMASKMPHFSNPAQATQSRSVGPEDNPYASRGALSPCPEALHQPTAEVTHRI